jgi:hypothetical protein
MTCSKYFFMARVPLSGGNGWPTKHPMKRKLKYWDYIRLVLFWSSIVFLIVGFYSITIAPGIDIEFTDWRMMHDYYEIIFGGIPIAILMTLTVTLKRSRRAMENFCIVLSTLFMTVLIVMSLVSQMFSIGFSVWENTSTLYVSKSNPEVKINVQRFDAGVLGSGGTRIVKLKPVLKYWNRVTVIDTATINPEEWIFINTQLK